MSRVDPAGLLTVDRRVREIPTPEGVPLRFRLALAGDRAGAFIIDALVIFVLSLLILLPIAILGILDRVAAEAIAALLVFLLRNFYFTGLEILWRGRTIGKRVIGLQVIDRSGRALRVEALFARNLSREIEVFIPLAVLAVPSLLPAGLPAWWRIGALLWAVFFAFFPLLNRDRLRLGDLLAGTIVVRSPKHALLPDLAGARRWAGAGSSDQEEGSRARTPAHVFAREQLEAYGIYELQVLERVLRESATPAETLRAVAERIASKIEWTGELADSRGFLSDFYRAQRAHLEGRLLLGDRREDKRAAAARRRGREGRAGNRPRG